MTDEAWTENTTHEMWIHFINCICTLLSFPCSTRVFKELRESKTSVLMSAIQVDPRLFSR